MRQGLIPSAILLLLVPVGSWAQLGNAPITSMGGPTPFGNGVQPQLNYAGAAAPCNLLSFSLSSEMGYNDNITNVSEPRVGSTFFALGPRIDVVRRGAHFGVDLDYYPYFVLYPGQQQYDTFNQALSVSVRYRVGPRLTLQARDSFSRQSGNFQPGLNNSSGSAPGLGPPTTLNQTVYTAFATQQDNAVRVDAIYQKSTRTSFTLFGGFDQLHFLGQPANGQRLYNSQGTSAGVQYAYRTSERTTLGVLYLYQSLNSGNSQSLIGARSHILTHSVLASFAWQLAPSVALTVFGGPQYIPSEVYSVQSPILPGGSGAIVNPFFPAQWNWSAGGTLTKRVEKTALSFSAQRMVTNGGGLFTSATSSTLQFQVRRKLKSRWDASFNLTSAFNDNLNLPSLPRNQIRSQTATFALDHPLGESLSTRLAYTYIHQSGGGLVPVMGTFEGNRVSVGFFYRAKSVPLGR
jgi:hypothetical protein